MRDGTIRLASTCLEEQYLSLLLSSIIADRRFGANASIVDVVKSKKSGENDLMHMF